MLRFSLWFSVLLFATSCLAKPIFTREQVELESMRKKAEETKKMVVPKTGWRHLGYHVGCELCGMMARDFYEIRHSERKVSSKVMSICDTLSSDGEWLKSLDIIQVDNDEDDLGGRYLKLRDLSPKRKDCRGDVECALTSRLCSRLVGGIPRNRLVHTESRASTDPSFEDYKTKMCEKPCRQQAKMRKPVKSFVDDTVFVAMSKDEIKREERYTKQRDEAYGHMDGEL